MKRIMGGWGGRRINLSGTMILDRMMLRLGCRRV
jgi:hypothetical protein